jgi:NTE family protein
MAPLSAEELLLLRKVPFFAPFTEKELVRVRGAMHRVFFPAGKVLFHEGEAGDALYLILSGRVKLVHLNGIEKLVAYINSNEVLGELALLTGEARRTTGVVDAPASLLALGRREFDALLKTVPGLALRLSRYLAATLRRTIAPSADNAPTGKTFVLLNRLPAADRVVFTVNLALSLVEQTRRKVILVEFAENGQDSILKPLQLAPSRNHTGSLRPEDLSNPATLRRLTVIHPSGLEILKLPQALIENRLLSGLPSLLNTLRRDNDFVLLSPLLRAGRDLETILETAHRVVITDKDGVFAGDEEVAPLVDKHVPEENRLRVRLTTSAPVPAERSHSSRIPWPAGLAEQTLRRGRPYLGREALLPHRGIDRLARRLGGLRIGFALGSGAALGYVTIGMLRVLERHGIFPDVVAGTSMGALIGSFYAAGKTPDELETIARGITKMKLWSLADFTVPWRGVILGDQVLKFLKSVIGGATFDDLHLPFAAVATDILTGEEVVLKYGPVAEAVRASLSLPFFFKPYFYRNRHLVDGGLVNPVPTSTIASLGADILLSVNITTKPSQKRLPGRRKARRPPEHSPNIFEVMLKTIYTMQYGISLTRAEPAHVVLAPDLSDFTWPEFHRAADIIKAGERYTEELMPKIKAQLPFFADTCKVPLRAPAAHAEY